MKWHLGTKTTSFGVRKCRWHLVSQGTQTPVSWMKVVFATPYPTFIILVTFLLCKLRCLVQLLLSSVTESVCVCIGGAFKPGGFYPHVRKWRYLTPWEETGLLFSCFSAMGTAIFFKLAQYWGLQPDAANGMAADLMCPGLILQTLHNTVSQPQRFLPTSDQQMLETCPKEQGFHWVRLCWCYGWMWSLCCLSLFPSCPPALLPRYSTYWLLNEMHLAWESLKAPVPPSREWSFSSGDCWSWCISVWDCVLLYFKCSLGSLHLMSQWFVCLYVDESHGFSHFEGVSL